MEFLSSITTLLQTFAAFLIFIVGYLALLFSVFAIFLWCTWLTRERAWSAHISMRTRCRPRLSRPGLRRAGNWLRVMFRL